MKKKTSKPRAKKGYPTGKTNRRKGHDAERIYRNMFCELGFSHCQTARYGSRLHDDSKIDLINLPLNVQVKAGYQKGLNHSKVLREMQDAIIKNFPEDKPEHTNPSIIIHKKDVGRGKRRTDFDELVTMTLADFVELLKKTL